MMIRMMVMVVVVVGVTIIRSDGYYKNAPGRNRGLPIVGYRLAQIINSAEALGILRGPASFDFWF